MVYRINGEARVCTVGPKFAILSKPGLDGTIFVQPTSLAVATSTEPMPSLSDNLRHNDVCAFEAEAQAERNGSKWRAVDGTVRVIRQAETITGEGTITKLDETNGQYGFIRSTAGDVFFNASSVRPPAKSIASIFKAGQLVRFTAVNCAAATVQRNNAVQLRAVMVCARNYKEPSLAGAAAAQKVKKPLTVSASEPVKNESPKPASTASSTPNVWAKRAVKNKDGSPVKSAYNVWTGKSLLSTSSISPTELEDKPSMQARQATGSVVSSERSTLNSPLSSCEQTDSSDQIYSSDTSNAALETHAASRVSPLYDNQRIGTPLLYSGCNNRPDSSPEDTNARPLDRIIGETSPITWHEHMSFSNQVPDSRSASFWNDDDRINDQIDELINFAAKSVLDDESDDVFDDQMSADVLKKCWDRPYSPNAHFGSFPSILASVEKPTDIWTPTQKDNLTSFQSLQSAPPATCHKTQFTFDLPKA